MGKNNKKKPQAPNEQHLILPVHSSAVGLGETSGSPPAIPIVDTHTHVLSTFSAYRTKYPDGQYNTISEFVRALYHDSAVSNGGVHPVEAIVDVWCEAPELREWRTLADSALTEEMREKEWSGIQYHFVMGVHPHNAKDYTDEVENEILEAMAHPRCVGWGEMGLDYHYTLSPKETQQEVLVRQLRHAVRLGKPLTIHTREADADIERILKAEVPKDHKIHVHCFTDSPELATSLLDHFPNLYIGITGVITYATNFNTSAVIRHLAADPSKPLRILLETDAPYMTPSNLYPSLSSEVKGRLPFCHTAMIPWTAEFVAGVAGDAWDTERVMRESRKNARDMYGV
ncbi:Metallo-dependent hydrolase [Sistotremastrum suecicum HHB10207 ss-3]|uniref:Metallo-dependent hydrolase n=1 Tax=Sistotremastrum suecicum HHB10207 ss-3 TaxID=1314776 RepID=A0A166FSU2_9AGAM|nr:Metallo-dependent hydrolase [Sistotremastrum suecicum HHB10207 ss-3]